MLGEAVERAVPAFAVAVALADGLERRLAHRHACLAALVRERDRDERFQAALAFLLPHEGEDEALG